MRLRDGRGSHPFRRLCRSSAEAIPTGPRTPGGIHCAREQPNGDGGKRGAPAPKGAVIPGGVETKAEQSITDDPEKGAGAVARDAGRAANANADPSARNVSVDVVMNKFDDSKRLIQIPPVRSSGVNGHSSGATHARITAQGVLLKQNSLVRATCRASSGTRHYRPTAFGRYGLPGSIGSRSAERSITEDFPSHRAPSASQTTSSRRVPSRGVGAAYLTGASSGQFFFSLYVRERCTVTCGITTAAKWSRSRVAAEPIEPGVRQG